MNDDLAAMIERKKSDEQKRMDKARERPKPAKRMVPDPSMSDAEFYHQQRQEMERANKSFRKPNLNIGKVEADVNLTTLIGGLAHIKRREDHHERAAARLLSDYTHAYGSAGGAVDASRVQVDTSIVAHDSGMAAMVDRNREIKSALDSLKKEEADAVVAIVVLGLPVSDVAPSPHWRATKATTSTLLRALDKLAVRWGYVDRRAVDIGD